jgi:hypothetical protein
MCGVNRLFYSKPIFDGDLIRVDVSPQNRSDVISKKGSVTRYFYSVLFPCCLNCLTVTGGLENQLEYGNKSRSVVHMRKPET